MSLSNGFSNLARSSAFAVLFALSLSSCAPGAPVAQLPDEPSEEQFGGDDVPENPDRTLASEPFVEPVLAFAEKQTVLEKYKHLDPKKVVPRNLLEKALVFFDANQSRFPNKNYISIVDFSKRSSKQRWFIIDMKKGSVWAIHVAHGKNSDRDADGYAESFSNTNNSNQSSLGFYRVSEQYSGKFGISARVDGLSTTNSNARMRAIVIHGAWYVWDSDVIQGRTWGCFGTSKDNAQKVTNLLKNGSLLYAHLSGVK